jgi:hypothetical protein
MLSMKIFAARAFLISLAIMSAIKLVKAALWISNDPRTNVLSTITKNLKDGFWVSLALTGIICVVKVAFFTRAKRDET